jgi:hypothetical protein
LAAEVIADSPGDVNSDLNLGCGAVHPEVVGGFYVDWHCHNVDVACWVKNAWLVSSPGLGNQIDLQPGFDLNRPMITPGSVASLPRHSRRRFLRDASLSVAGTAIMGRESAYSALSIEWNDALRATQDLSPAKLELGPLPVAPVPMPGRYRMT